MSPPFQKFAAFLRDFARQRSKVDSAAQEEQQASACLAVDDIDGALHWYRQLTSHPKHGVRGSLLLAQLLNSIGRFNEAETALAGVSATGPYALALATERALSLLRQKRASEALQIFGALEADLNGLTFPSFGTLIALLVHDRHAIVNNLLSQPGWQVYAPKLPKTLALFCHALLVENQVSAAEKLIATTMNFTPLSFRVLNSVATELAKKGQQQSARALAERLVAAALRSESEGMESDFQSSGMTYLQLAQSLHRLRYDDLAIQCFERSDELKQVIEHGPAHVDDELTLGAYSKSLLRLGQEETVYSLLQRIVPNSIDRGLLDAFVRACIRTERFSEGLRVLEELIARKPESVPGIYNTARILFATGQINDALETARRALKLAPDDTEVRALVEVVQGHQSVLRQQQLPDLPRFAPYTSNPKRVLVVLENSLPQRRSGYTYRTHAILQLLAKVGYEPIAVTRADFPWDAGIVNAPDCEIVEGITYLRTHSRSRLGYTSSPLDVWLQDYADAVLEIAKQYQPAVIHAVSNFKNALVGRAVASALGIPWIYELRGLWEDSLVAKGVISETSDRYTAFQEIESSCLSHADAVITISHRLKQDISRRGVEDSRIRVVPNGVDPLKFPVVQRDSLAAERLGLGSGPVFGYIGSFCAYEGLDLLLHAFVEIAQAVPSARLMLVGDGEEQRSLAQLASSLGLDDKVLMPGRVAQNEVLTYYSLIDVFTLPRLPLRVCEFVPPLKPFEAMATGRCLLVSDVAALRELIIPGETGELFVAGNKHALVVKAIELARNENHRRQVGRAAAEWVRNNHTWELCCRNYELLYESLAINSWPSAHNNSASLAVGKRSHRHDDFSV